MKDFDLKQNYPMPDDNMDPELKKDKSYYLACVKHFYMLYTQNKCLVPYSGDEKTFELLRAYGAGRQPIHTYLDQLYPIDSFQRKRNIAFSNISKSIVKVIPKFKHTLLGIFLQQEYEYIAAFIDPASSKLKEEEKGWLKWRLNNEFQKFMDEVGMRPSRDTQSQDMPQFNTERQIDTFFEQGGFQLDVEIAIKNLLDITRDDSKWDTVLLLKFLNDILDLGMWACEDYVDTDMRVKGKYVDPARLICPWSELPDHSDKDFGGYLGEVSVSELRRSGEFSDIEIINITKAYAGRNGNTSYPADLYTSTQQYYNQYKCYPNDDMRVTVMTMYWVSPDTEKYTTVTNKRDGTTVTRKVDFDYKLRERSKREGKLLNTGSVDFVQRCKWIVGTNYVYNCGKLDFVPREIKRRSNGSVFRRAVVPIHVTRLEGPSMVESCKEAADQIQLDVMRLRVLKTKIPSAPAVAVVKEALEGITLGNVKMGPRDLMDMFQEDGWLIFQRLDDFQNPNGAGNPIIPIDMSNIYNLIKTYREEINASFSDIRSLTGISEIVDGTTPAPRTGLGVANISASATNNAIYIWKQCYEMGFLNFLKNATLRWQIVNQTEDIEAIYRPYGSETTKSISLVKNSLNGECALRIQLMSTAEERNLLLQEANTLKNNRATQNTGGITPSQYIMVARILRSGNLLLAQQMLAVYEEETREKDIQQQMALANNKAQQDQQSALVAQQASRETLAFEYDLRTKFMIREQQEIRETKLLEKGMAHKTTIDNTLAGRGELPPEPQVQQQIQPEQISQPELQQ